MESNNQEAIVQKMIDAGEPEENIATVIQSFKSKAPEVKTPDITPSQDTIPAANEPGNIDLAKQPKVPNPNGGTSTVFSKSYNIDGKETLLPSVTPDGRFLKTDDEVINEYKKTGNHLGKFNTPEEANKYAEQLHNDYASGKYDQSAQPEFSGSYKYLPSTPDTEPAQEPDTYWGGFFKGIKDYGKDITSGITSGLESAANPKTLGDILSLVIPSELPHIARGNLGKVAESVAADKPLESIASTVEKVAPKAESVVAPVVKPQGFDPASLGFNKSTQAPDEVSQLIKSAGLEEAPPIEVVGQETPKPDNLAAMQQSRSAAMDARNKGFQGSIANDMSSGETRGFATQGNEPLAGLNPKTKALLDKNNQIAKMANETQKKGIWPEIRDANRALLTSIDFSALGRQGKPLMLTKAYWTSLDDMFKSWGSERAYQSVMDSINEHPNFQSTTSPISGKVAPSLADRAGLSIGNAEQFQSNIAEKFIPGVRPSERAYNAFLNKLRADHFNTLVKDSIDAGVDVTKNDTELRKLGTFINDATGKGSLGKLERYAPILNEAFFAPKLMASRVNMYKRWLNPMTYADSNPVIRKQALKSLLATVGFGMAVGELARLGGAQVNNDPQSSDFRKIKIGDTRIDPFAGHQQYAVGAARLAPQAIGGGYTTSSTSGKRYDLANPKFGGPSRASVASQFFQNKLAPVPSLVWSWMEGKDWNGQPFEIKKALLDRTVPLVMQDLYDVYKEDPSKFPAGIFKENPTATKVGLSALPILGEGMQTYGR